MMSASSAYTHSTWVCLFGLTLLAAGCAGSQYGHLEQMGQPEEKRSSLTPGMAKKTIIKGQTKQAEVLEIFGPPDLVTTTQAGGEMWGYDRVSRETAFSSFGIGVLGGGLPGDALIGGVAGAKAGQTTQTVRTLFLLIYFDKDSTVIDYKLSATRF